MKDNIQEFRCPHCKKTVFLVLRPVMRGGIFILEKNKKVGVK